MLTVIEAEDSVASCDNACSQPLVPVGGTSVYELRTADWH
jgi:hypothetical protein